MIIRNMNIYYLVYSIVYYILQKIITLMWCIEILLPSSFTSMYTIIFPYQVRQWNSTMYPGDGAVVPFLNFNDDSRSLNQQEIKRRLMSYFAVLITIWLSLWLKLPEDIAKQLHIKLIRCIFRYCHEIGMKKSGNLLFLALLTNEYKISINIVPIYLKRSIGWFFFYWRRH